MFHRIIFLLVIVSSLSCNFNRCAVRFQSLGTLSKDVFERRTSTGSEAFSLFICLDANKLVLLSLFSLLKKIYPRVSTKPLPNDAKSPPPVDVRRSKTLLLKLPIHEHRLQELSQNCARIKTFFKITHRYNTLILKNRHNKLFILLKRNSINVHCKFGAHQR